jgi:hypothetical protein
MPSGSQKTIVYAATPRPPAIALTMTMPHGLVNINAASMARCWSDRFIGPCGVWATPRGSASERSMSRAGHLNPLSLRNRGPAGTGADGGPPNKREKNPVAYTASPGLTTTSLGSFHANMECKPSASPRASPPEAPGIPCKNARKYSPSAEALTAVVITCVPSRAAPSVARSIAPAVTPQ